MLDRREFIEWMAAAVPAGSMFRFARTSRPLPQTKQFTLHRRNVPVAEIKLEFIRDAMSAFNSHYWRGERPRSIQLAEYSWQRTADDSFDMQVVFVRRPMPRFTYLLNGRWQIHPAQLYALANFDEFDFGEPLPA